MKSSLNVLQRRRGPRPGSLSDLQQKQREITKQRILEVTQEILSQKSFEELSIDDVLTNAPVSRSTFYRHFKSKKEIIFELYDVILPESFSIFEQFSVLPNDIDHISRCIWNLIGDYRATGALSHVFLQLGITDREFRGKLWKGRQRLIDHLAKRVPAFALTQGQSPTEIQKRVRADILMMQIFRICSEIALHGELPYEDAYVRCTALDIISFLSDI